MIRVLVVDDSVVVRRMISDVLNADTRITVVATAPNGAIALQKLTQVNPDLVLLDVEMPDMDGIETVARLRETFPRLPVIMCSSLTERGADVTLRALAAGATDYVTKPTAAVTQADRLDSFKSQLIEKVVALGHASLLPAPPLLSRLPASPSLAPVVRLGKEPISALCVGCSTGGPNALGELFRGLPSDLPVPIFIVQHMPPLFTRMLAERLAAASGVSVVEAEHGATVEPGRAYIAPGDNHLLVGRDGARVVTLLNKEPPENSCRPAVDVLFRSVARLYGAGVLACVMTGMGHDGARGSRNIVDAGGNVIVQSAETCVVPSMPGAVVAAGLADKVLPLSQLASELVARVRRASEHARFAELPRREA
jgi:two-component system chemotaxis response regulator CheB